MRQVALPDGRVWLRLAEPEWADPLDASYASVHGGRWNPPHSFATLYLNADVVTARLQIERLLEGSPVRPDDLDDNAYVLVAATLPRAQTCVDAVSEAGLRALSLPVTYPRDASGQPVGHGACQTVGVKVRAARLRGVWCRSSFGDDSSARELAWFPATVRSRARTVWTTPLPLGYWRHATDWTDLDMPDQPSPDPA